MDDDEALRALENIRSISQQTANVIFPMVPADSRDVIAGVVRTAIEAAVIAATGGLHRALGNDEDSRRDFAAAAEAFRRLAEICEFVFDPPSKEKN